MGTKHDHSSRPGRVTQRAAGVLAVAAVALVTVFVGVAAAASPTAADEVSTSQDTTHGTYLTADHTVYTLSKTCSSKCEKVWIPAVLPTGVKKATAGDGVSAKKLGTTKLSGGDLQITYGGEPLYWYVNDSAATDVTGMKASHKYGTPALIVTAKPTAGSGSSGNTGTTDKGTGGTAF
jgi:predicted lipoprotein with Yx(FWY)xxD motif